MSYWTMHGSEMDNEKPTTDRTTNYRRTDDDEWILVSSNKRVPGNHGSGHGSVPSISQDLGPDRVRGTREFRYNTRHGSTYGPRNGLGRDKGSERTNDYEFNALDAQDHGSDVNVNTTYKVFNHPHSREFTNTGSRGQTNGLPRQNNTSIHRTNSSLKRGTTLSRGQAISSLKQDNTLSREQAISSLKQDNTTNGSAPMFGDDDDDHYKKQDTVQEKKMNKDNRDNESEYTRKQKNDNYKKILCKNITSCGKCIYNNKCLYAHSLEEQNVDAIRLIAYDMIKKNNDLSHVDLSKSKQLYTNLLSLSKLCPHCDEGTCTGGYNCKHGVCDKIYIVCQIDLNKGTCDGGCGKVHLTTKGLVPYGVNIMRNLKTKNAIPKATILDEDFFKKLANCVEKKNKVKSEKDSDDYQDDDKHNNNKQRNESIQNNSSPNEFTRYNFTRNHLRKTTDRKNSNNITGNDNDSVCSVDSDKLSIPDATTGSDSFDDFRFDTISKREEKLEKSIFKIDISSI
jgi:hypothetical protein